MWGGTQAKLHHAMQSKTGYQAPLWTINNGVEVADANHVLLVNGGNPAGILSAQHATTKAIVASISCDEFEDAVKRIHVTYFFADYRRIKEHDVFRRLYNYGQRQVNYFDGKQVVPLTCNTFPCMRCGLVVPESNITIDHQKPQEGGQVLAVAKVFRAMGLTEEGPKGAKGKVFAAADKYGKIFLGITQNAIGDPIAPHPRNAAAGTDRAKRLTLNAKGALIYAALLWGGDKDTLYNDCMHSLLNLKPLCLRCNTSKGNAILG